MSHAFGRAAFAALLVANCFHLPWVRAAIVINEIVDDNRAADSTGGDPDTMEFIELYNSGNTAVNIGGWTLNYWQLGTTAGTGSYFAANDEIPLGTILAPGEFYVLGHNEVPNVDQPLGSAINLFPNGNTVFELRDGPQTTGLLVDAVAIETYVGAELANLKADHPAQVGGGYWGQSLTMFAEAPNVPATLARFIDGRDTNVNGRDFGFLPVTPGTSNNANIPQVPSHQIQDVTGMTPGTALSTKYFSSFVLPRVINPQQVGPAGASVGGVPQNINPKAIAPSPQGSNAIIAWDETGGGNSVYSKELVSKFELYAYIETADLNLGQTAIQSEATTYGIGTTDPFFGTPNQAGLLASTSTQNGNTGIGWMIQRAEAANSGNTTTLLQLIDFNDGGDSVLAANDWQIKQTIDLSGTLSGWHSLSIDYNSTTGDVIAKFDTQTFTFNTITGLLGTFYVGYRENLPGTGGAAARPPTFDLFIPSTSNLPGDYDKDGDVDSNDYNTWRNAFGTAVTAGSGADGNGDGVVNAADYTIWRDHFGSSSSGGASVSTVPEPGTALLVVLGAALFPLRRRHAGSLNAPYSASPSSKPRAAS